MADHPFSASPAKLSRRRLLTLAASGAAAAAVSAGATQRAYSAARRDPRWVEATNKGLEWLSRTQSSRGQWNTQMYPTAMAALAGTALIASGSTTTQGPYAQDIARAADYIISKSRQNGLIGDPQSDSRYTYGHGFAMLFLSQVLGEEGLIDRREELVEVLTKAVEFSGNAQTPAGGWGYVSARDGNNFDEGSTTITQVQGLRGCRNAGIPVPAEIIDRAKEYIYVCKNPDGGISYSSRQRGSSRPAITAAALAALYNAGDYDSEHVPEMWQYAKENLHDIHDAARSFGHWHYTYLYYSQVVYRQGNELWGDFRNKLYDRIVGEQKPDGNWDGQIHPVYITACNLIMLQLDRGFLPIYQR
ncbi:prenyltransferase/squalene oxidase repeat-containing protein [Roseimaritima sediminicola]|uniref:prenyltransferase/squalene oxidase repeat-containing protein n=1 Tax=Roseimaritima sediminicola TaxID=2662066 RepID=UPI001F3ADB43|nr:prenyltransferase/squalene oxidase repeat-containing protein [Roseimaritima sediminicola]